MLDAALIEKCADPSLAPAMVARFIETAGSTDPLAVSVKSGDRLILIPQAKTPEEAMETIRQNVGHAVVRVGITQLPAGIKDVSELTPSLVDACENLKQGTRMFAKILHIATEWYGNPTSNDSFSQIFDDAISAWKTGAFEGVEVFRALDPGGQNSDRRNGQFSGPDAEAAAVETGSVEPERAGIRVDLGRIGGGK